MPTYEFQCANDDCRVITEEVHSMKDVPNCILCPKCWSVAPRILSLCAVHSDSPAWIDQGLRDHIQGDGEPPITTRGELDAYCKAKNIQPCS